MWILKVLNTKSNWLSAKSEITCLQSSDIVIKLLFVVADCQLQNIGVFTSDNDADFATQDKWHLLFLTYLYDK